MFTRLKHGLLRRLGMNAPTLTGHIVARFLDGPCGTAYGVSRADKQRLLKAMEQTLRHIPSGTAMSVHIALAEAVLTIPEDAPGDLIECGVWKGASTCTLSLLAELTGRRLKVCDSFAGLPDEGHKLHTGLHTGVYGYYREGMFAGARAEVEANVLAHGAMEVCDFIEGYFHDSLTQLHEPLAFGFLDVDLEGSLRDCVQYIWPLLNEGAYLYSDDAGDLAVVKVFFDESWWQTRFEQGAPGFVGSGCGLPLGTEYSSLGYARKLTSFRKEDWKQVPFLHYDEREITGP